MMTQHPDQPHTLRSYDDDLLGIRALVEAAGDLAQRQVLAAVDAMSRRDLGEASQIVAADEDLDRLQAQIEHDAISTIGRRAPMADDLREIISAIKIAGELERIGDYAKNIAKRIPVIAETAPVDPAVIIPEIAGFVANMVRSAITAYIERDADAAMNVIRRDATVDEYYNSLFRALLVHMIENPKHTTQSVHLLFVTKNLERIGDRATNIAEMVYYSATGQTAGTRAPAVSAAYDAVVPPEGK